MMIAIVRQLWLAAVVGAIAWLSRGVSAHPCELCAEFVSEHSFVCGADGDTYATECHATFCNDTIAVCAGSCPCAEDEDPASDHCSDKTFPQKGHQNGPGGAYDVVASVAWPEDCCALCGAEPECASYTWTSVFWDEGTDPACFLFTSPMDASSPDTDHSHCYAGNKIPLDYESGEDLPPYWKAQAIAAGNDYTRLGFSPEQRMWYLDDMPTCVGWGYYSDACDATTAVCSSLDGTHYGFGTEQMEVLHDMFHENTDRHWLCPECHYPHREGETMACAGPGATFYVPDTELADSGLAVPGHVSPHNPGVFVDCDCNEHFLGKDIPQGTYWWGEAIAQVVDPSRLSHHAGEWFYDEQWTCVGKGAALDACDDAALFCSSGSGTAFGSGDQQMGAVAMAISSPGNKHPSCPV